MTQAIILTTQRTGSTFLVTCLDSHPEVCCLGELLAGSRLFRVPELIYKSRYGTKAYRFLRSGAWHPTRMMRRFLDEARIGSIDLELRPAMAFKVMYNQIRPPWILNFLRRRPELRILHLRRSNLLKVYVSNRLLKVKRDDHWQPHAIRPVTPISQNFSSAAALDYMRRALIEYEAHELIFRDHHRLALTYESLIDGQMLRAEVARDICRFLAISDHPMQSNLIKINPDRLEDMIANYEEFAEGIRNSEFSAMLD